MSAMSSPVLDQMTGSSSGQHHVDFKPVDNSEAEDALRGAETVYQLAMRQIPPAVEVSQELLIYPEGEVDAVTITERDVEGLQPGRFLSNNIVDFYIRFLERGLSPEHGNRFYFFTSFFFTKLLHSTVSTGMDPCKVDYEQLRKWTEQVNLFAKDYVFIPILKSSHWSLVVICHLRNLSHPLGETMRSPCVVHLDPIEGQHESFEGLIQSYVLQAWMERFQVSSNGDQLLELCQMKYVEAKVPEQDNFHDCGLHVLNYVEAFLLKSASSDFNFPSSEMGLHFISPHFVREVSGKRKRIENLIHELSNISQKRASKRRAIQEVLQSTQNLRFPLFQEGNSEACIKDVQTVGLAFFNGQGSEINHPSTYEDALDAQDGQLTLMSRGDNEPLDGPQIGPTEYEDRSEDKANIFQKRMKLSSNVCIDLHALSSPDSSAPNPQPISQGRSFEDEAVALDSACGTVEFALHNVIPESVFSSFDEDLQSTLFNLVQECSFRGRFQEVKNGRIFDLEEVCRRLAILQDCEPREILNYVFKLWKLDFVNVADMVFEEGKLDLVDLVFEEGNIDLWKGKTWFLKLQFYEKISKEVLCKNPQFQTYCNSFPIEQSSIQYIRVLSFDGCCELQHLDLREFPSLRSLAILHCPQFNLVTGWGVATSLASLEIWDCDAYLDFPEVQYLFSLRELEVSGRKSNKSATPWHLSQFSQCAKLRRLRICDDESFSEIADLENLKELKFLEFLSLKACTFSSIRGLSGLRALTVLHLQSCEGLRRVLGIGCLKGLTHLDMCWSGVENIQGVEELHLLTSLDLYHCSSLEGLPFLGHLKALIFLDLRETSVKEIPGIEDLINLRTLKWNLE